MVKCKVLNSPPPMDILSLQSKWNNFLFKKPKDWLSDDYRSHK